MQEQTDNEGWKKKISVSRKTSKPSEEPEVNTSVSNPGSELLLSTS